MKENVFKALSMGLCLSVFVLASCDVLDEALEQEKQSQGSSDNTENNGQNQNEGQTQNSGQNQENGQGQSGGTVSDSIVLKSGSTGSISADGTITINGHVFSKTAQITAVPKGSVAKITCTFPLVAP